MGFVVTSKECRFVIIGAMRKVMIQFLAFLMLMPTLACAMPACLSIVDSSASMTASHCETSHAEHEMQWHDDCADVIAESLPAVSTAVEKLLFDHPVYDDVVWQTQPLFANGKTTQLFSFPPINTGPSSPLYLTTQRFRL